MPGPVLYSFVERKYPTETEFQGDVLGRQKISWAAEFVISRSITDPPPTTAEWSRWTAAWRSQRKRAATSNDERITALQRTAEQRHISSMQRHTAAILQTSCNSLGLDCGLRSLVVPPKIDLAAVQLWAATAPRTATSMVALDTVHVGGYNGYGLVEAAVFEPLVQKQNTINIPHRLIGNALRAIPSLAELDQWVAEEVAALGVELGYRLRASPHRPQLGRVHFLNQVCLHAVFRWHNDVETSETASGSSQSDTAPNPVFTVVVQLTADQSSMQVYGFEPFRFAAGGAAAAFLSAACHRSAPEVAPATVPWNKVALFYYFI